MTVRVLPVGTLAVAAIGSVLCLAQEPAPADDAAQRRFRVSQHLVVVDAVVTDGEGRHVTDLGPEDFEVEQGGKARPVRQAVYVETSRPPAGPSGAGKADAPGSVPAAPTPAPPAAPSSRDVARTIAVVVDDLGLSWESTYHVHRALRRFVDEQVRPSDLVAILRTSAGVGALQQFTTDRRLLHAAVERVQWTAQSRSVITAFSALSDPNPRAELLAAGSLAALDYVIRGVGRLPGRKAVLFFSEGLDLFGNRIGSGRLSTVFSGLMDRANAAGVVVYTIDARGLSTGGLTAEDDPRVKTGFGVPVDGSGSQMREAILSDMRERREFLRNTQEALYFLARETGGFAVLNNNDLNLGISRVLSDLAGYYLIGYEAPEGAPQSWERSSVRVRLKRPGLRLRARRGAFGPSFGGQPERREERDPVLFAALSPFHGGTLPVRLNAFVARTPGDGFLLRADLFLEGVDLEFRTSAEGLHEAEYEIGTFVIGDNGSIPGLARRKLSLKLTDEQHRRAVAEGLLYTVPVSLKKPGDYQLRVAVRDLQGPALGSASQFIEVPRAGKGRLAISSVVLGPRADTAGAGPPGLRAGCSSAGRRSRMPTRFTTASARRRAST
jgi:VWFA-related protein